MPVRSDTALVWRAPQRAKVAAIGREGRPRTSSQKAETRAECDPGKGFRVLKAVEGHPGREAAAKPGGQHIQHGAGR